jgi:hypothetical protein
VTKHDLRPVAPGRQFKKLGSSKIDGLPRSLSPKGPVQANVDRAGLYLIVRIKRMIGIVGFELDLGQ